MKTIRVTVWAIASLCVLCVAAPAQGEPESVAASPDSQDSVTDKSAVPAESGTEAASQADAETETPEYVVPWDYSPYKVLIWVASHDPKNDAAALTIPLTKYLDRDFHALWQTTIENAPAAVSTAAFRSMDDLTYDQIVASDPVIAVKRSHDDAVRIQSVRTLAPYVSNVLVTKGMRADVLARADEAGDDSLAGAAGTLKEFDGDVLSLAAKWQDEETEAVLVTRGQATLFDDPKAKLLTLPISHLVSSAIETYDKIFVVRIENGRNRTVRVAEMETLMRTFGEVVEVPYSSDSELPSVVGHGVTEAFAPMLRIDNAGQKTAEGMIRGGGLIMDPESPANIPVGSVLQPMVRKNDRNGKPIAIGRLDWAVLLATEQEGSNVKMDFYTGRPGGLQGRKNKRTFKMAMLLKPHDNDTTIRLHAKGREDLPLIGYELYQRELKSKSMTFVGRTDWDGRIDIEKTDDPMRLLYVKNGGAVLARLPIVPGYTELEIADLTGDDLRLQAESYVRGVQNAIVDLVAIRQLLAARIRKRLESGQFEEAEELYIALQQQPTNEKIANDMGKKQAAFLNEIDTRQFGQRKKIDDMFKTTREMLTKQINQVLIRDLGEEVNQARRNGGQLAPDDGEDEQAGTTESGF